MYTSIFYGLQVFPLLMKQFSAREQASLVWQFICSVPMILLEKLLPWMMSFLPSEEQPEVVNCLRDVVPNEKLLQEVASEPSFPCRAATESISNNKVNIYL